MFSWDFMGSGRAAIIAGTNANCNVFQDGSELFRTGTVPSAPLLPNCEIQSISDKPEDVDGRVQSIGPATRSSQRGHEAHARLLQHLLTGTKLNKVSAFLKGAHIDVVDLHVHSGDKLLASLAVSQSQEVTSRQITVRHVLVQNNSVKSSTQASM